MRKKLPLISGILNVLEKLKGNTGIIENTSVATHTIAAGKYVIWKNDLYKASSAISIGDTLSLYNLTAVSDGIANELNSKLTPSAWQTLTNANAKYCKVGNIAFVKLNAVSMTARQELNLGTLPEGYRPAENITFAICGGDNREYTGECVLNSSTGVVTSYSNTSANFWGLASFPCI